MQTRRISNGASSVREWPQPCCIRATHSLDLPCIALYFVLSMTCSIPTPPDQLQDAASKPATCPHEPPLEEYFEALYTAMGPQGWWPADSAFEVVVGAFLTQGTGWKNVELAIEALWDAGLLDFEAMEKTPVERIETVIRSSGYFRQKARKLKAFCGFVRREHNGSLDEMFDLPTGELRRQLLSIFGIGPETADTIMLYAAGHATFVVDTYTKRLLVRHGWIDERASYDEVRQIFEARMEPSPRRFNEFHALIVNTGKNFCHKQRPKCAQCPLGRFLAEGR